MSASFTTARTPPSRWPLARARRRALDDALREIDAGAKVPSTQWRRRYALLLGLERVLSEDEPRLADGALLNPHQVDALSGTLTALLAAVQNGHGAPPPTAEPVLAVDDEPEPEPRWPRPRRTSPTRTTTTSPTRGRRGRRGRRAESTPTTTTRPTRTTTSRGRRTATSPRTPGRTTPARRRRGRRGGRRRRPQRPQALLVRARHRRRQDRRRDGLRRGLAHRRHPDPHPPPQPRRPVPRRAARPRLRQARVAGRCSTAPGPTAPTAR